MNEKKRVATQAEYDIAQEKARGKLSYYRLTLEDKEYIRRQVEENINHILHYYKESKRQFYTPTEEEQERNRLRRIMTKSLVKLCKEDYRNNEVITSMSTTAMAFGFRPMVELTIDKYYLNEINPDPTCLSCWRETTEEHAKRVGSYKHTSYPLDCTKVAIHRVYKNFKLVKEWKEGEE